jgi:aryl-alcohol dehydrogenase-like predicted oxidoreductase
LLYREEEREMLPYCEKNNIGVIPWSPLARGYLARPHEEFDATARGQSDSYAKEHPYFEGNGQEINERVQELATDKDVSMAQIALSWVLHKDVVDAPIVGVTSVEHLEEAVEALDISLSDSDIEYLEEPYEPVSVSGHE